MYINKNILMSYRNRLRATINCAKILTGETSIKTNHKDCKPGTLISL